MAKLTNHGVCLSEHYEVTPAGEEKRAEGRKKTIAYRILEAHNHSGNMDQLKLKFDALVSPDNNYVNILQTARASGIKKFPVPYVLSNCHNTLCAVGGTINQDDHVFGLGNVKKYGGIFVPPYRAVLHQYMREMMAGCGKMILGSDSHTRYGAVGTMGIGEGGGEVAKQLLGRTYDIACPPVIAVKLTGAPRDGVGPQDVALELISATFANNFNKNKILEFVGDGIANLSMEYRMGIDVMTTESAALSSIWCTDEKTQEYFEDHGRAQEYRPLRPKAGAYYDGLIEIDLSKTECMIALPFHPSHAVPIREFKEHMEEMLLEVEKKGQEIKGKNGKPFSIMSHIRDGEFYPDQALISGCCGGLFENIVAVADILKGYGISGEKLNLGVNPASLPIMADLMDQGIAGELAVCGVTLRPAICGPCFGVTDVPANNEISIRHMTRNYPNREGSKPGQGQMAGACLMDARSIAATVRNGGRLTPATDLVDVEYRHLKPHFDPQIYKNQVFDNFGKGNPDEELVMGPNIADWPEMFPLTDHLLLRVAGSYKGSVTTDELIPSGEPSSFRSNPEKISEYTMISRDKDYVGRAKAVRALDEARRSAVSEARGEEEEWEKQGENKTGLEHGTEGSITGAQDCDAILSALMKREHCTADKVTIGSLMVSDQIGDGSSREQAASCQKVLGGFANLANEYATKRYRSNLINWGLLPLRTEESLDLPNGTWILVENIQKKLESGEKEFSIEVLGNGADSARIAEEGSGRKISCTLDSLTEDERKILSAGCLINYYKN
ncbi:hydratase [Brotaphodocola sp.]|uniref:hydratase n=1 Tax=Brotaphodocola sp. TaxID=3073577 RepID=UPI003D7D86BA